MELKFLGKGSAFNNNLLNTSAYFIKGTSLYLIDCGETVFSELMNKGILNKKIKHIYVYITHTHSDHSGSLGTLASYAYYVMNNPITLILPDDKKYIKSIDKLMELFGCAKKYKKKKATKFKKINSEYRETKHSPILTCFSIIFRESDKTIFYSGDTSETRILEELIEKENVDKAYMDVCMSDYPDNIHLYYKKLENIKLDKSKIFGMHLNKVELEEVLLKEGYNVVKL